MAQSTETDWVSRFADDVIAESERRAAGAKHSGADAPVVVVASGLSPSGPIHLGNLREVMTPHLVADEIRRRGYTVRHLISWDDYDRYRKVPNGVPGIDASWAEHIGKPSHRCRPRPGPRTRTGPSTSRPPWSRRWPSWAWSTTRSARPSSIWRAPTASRSCTP